MDNLNPSTIYYVLGSAIAVGGLVTRALAKRDKEQEERFDAKLLIVATAHNKLEETLNLRLAAMKTEQKDTDRRLAQVEREYISRADHAEFRHELMSAVKEIGASVTHSLDGFRATVEKVMERQNKLEREATRS